MRIVQYLADDGARAVGLLSDNGDRVAGLSGVGSIRELAARAITERVSLQRLTTRLAVLPWSNMDDLLAGDRLLAPIDHPDPAHMFVTGTGLSHLGSAAARDAMHQRLAATAEAEMTDSMRMFRWGVEGGKPLPGSGGVQPEWFYKGDGSSVVRPGAALPSPEFADDGSEEAEIVGVYLVGPDGTPWRIGYTLGNEFSDHVMEQQNYLYLAHSKLRACALGPELLLGDLPGDVRGVARVIRSGAVLWEGEFLSGEDNMCHSIANIEHHHFKYGLFRRPGDVHCHFFGAATLSFAAGVRTQPGDAFELSVPLFGTPLRNTLAAQDAPTGEVRAL